MIFGVEVIVNDAGPYIPSFLHRPEELDEAVRRRFVKRIYIPLPDSESRRQLLTMLLSDCKHDVDGKAMEELVARTEGFSGKN